MSAPGDPRCHKRLCLWGLVAACQWIPVAEGAWWQAAEPDAGILRLRINNQAGFDSKVLVQAEEIVSRIFKHAGLETMSLHCANFAVIDAACAPRRLTDVVINLAPIPPVRLGGTADALGLVPSDPEGTLVFMVYIFRPTIEKLTKLHAVDASGHGLVLGHAIAHEIGHLLLNSIKHSLAGIMMADWDKRALHLARQGCLVFLPSQGEKIRAEVQVRNAAKRVRGPRAGMLRPDPGVISRQNATGNGCRALIPSWRLCTRPEGHTILP